MSTAVAPSLPSTDDSTADRAFLLSMARIPLIAFAWLALAWGASAAVEQFGWHSPVGGKLLNLGPIAVICFGMLVAAFIDGYAFKVPNWCTLSLVVSGWYIGILHDLGQFAIPGATPTLYGGVLAALGCTALGFLVLFPALFIGGMGQGDVKMTMGFGSWIGVYFGGELGAQVLLWSFAIGAIVGGIFGLVMMIARREPHKNLANTKEIFTDLKVLATEGVAPAAARAQSRRPGWWRLPYGVPLCVGFLGYLWYSLMLAA